MRANLCYNPQYNVTQVIWKEMYLTNSGTDVGSMYRMRNVLGRSNISNTPRKNVNAAENFLTLVVESHVLAAAMQLLNLKALDDMPKEHSKYFPQILTNLILSSGMTC